VAIFIRFWSLEISNGVFSKKLEKYKFFLQICEPILQNSVFIHERVSHKGEVRPERRLKK
jgi:hypothetical protein